MEKFDLKKVLKNYRKENYIVDNLEIYMDKGKETIEEMEKKYDLKFYIINDYKSDESLVECKAYFTIVGNKYDLKGYLMNDYDLDEAEAEEHITDYFEWLDFMEYNFQSSIGYNKDKDEKIKLNSMIDMIYDFRKENNMLKEG